MAGLYRTLNRRGFMTLLAGGAGLAVAGCSDSDLPASPAATQATNEATSIEEMIGQMLMVGFRGYTLATDSPTHAGIVSEQLGNVVLFDYDVPSATANRNIESPAQVQALNRSLQDLAPRRPLLIAADQEGGLVARLKPAYGFPETHSPQELGDLRDISQTRDSAREMARTLAAAGVNLNLAPVVDVNVNPENPVIGGIERSFSADPEEVAAQALAFIEGHHAEGVLCTLKHFPGHGSSLEDSHLGFVDVTTTWTEQELIPFERLIDAGMADAVMTAHIFNANLDDTFPATLSRKTITGVLREQLGFEGVIITDDMQMGAIANFFNFEDSVEAAIEAGADIIAIANNSATYEPMIGERAFNAILAAVRGGRISETRIEESFNRIMATKSRLA